VFERALALPDGERAAYLAAACGSRHALRNEVERMLDSHDRAAGFLSTPATALLDGSAVRSLEGQRIGPYQLGARIGAGGMGEVYRARDTRLDRTVAVKVLPPDFVYDPHARERLVREGRAIAALNHPNICALYDVGDTTASAEASPLYLVMEYLEGETLADRLARGALPMAHALQVAMHIASALDKAHRAGIVHRDLKPGNVFLVRGGASAAPTAKLLDFGLAKAAAPRGADSATRHAIAANLTTPGTIIGTVQYMAPEQVEGNDTDVRTDIFAFGTVLHEMLTGTKAFAGKSQASLTVAILEHEPPPVSAHLPAAPPALDRTVRKCLAKDPDERWQTAADLLSELQWIAQDREASDPRAGVGGKRTRIAWQLAAMMAIITIAALTAAVVVLRRPVSSPVAVTPKQFVLSLPEIIQSYNGSALALLPDGSGLVYQGGGTGLRDWRLIRHTLSDGVARPLAGTEGAGYVFFSPDGKWLGFLQNLRLKRMPLAGGLPVDICNSSTGGGASWGADDRIVFTGEDGLWRVPASGGAPARLTMLSAGEAAHSQPQILPGGDAVIFTVLTVSGAMEDAAIGVVSIRTGQRRLLVKGGSSARYSPTGHLVFARGSELLAVAFDRDRLTIMGNPVRVVENVQNRQAQLAAQFDLSADGTLAYISGGDEINRTLVWADRSGALLPLPAPPRPYAHLVLLPDGQGLILEIEGKPHNLWRYDFSSGALMLLTPEGANHRPVLSPDGRFMAYSSDRTVPRSLFRQATDGSGTAERLLDAAYAQDVTSWSRDGHWLAIMQRHPQNKSDIIVLALDGDRRARPFLATPFNELSAVFSPDGRWIAYVSDESGSPQVFMTSFPGPGPRKQVSTNGGAMPLFSNDGRSLFYMREASIMSADLVTEPTLTIGAPHVAFEIPGAQRVVAQPYPVTATADRVLYVREPDIPRSAHVVVNWFEELRRITAAR
jgi:serine/threonine protein kinase/Tol biopolymer transport system component